MILAGLKSPAPKVTPLLTEEGAGGGGVREFQPPPGPLLNQGGEPLPDSKGKNESLQNVSASMMPASFRELSRLETLIKKKFNDQLSSARASTEAGGDRPEMGCHSERSEESRLGLLGAVCLRQGKIPRFARNDISWVWGAGQVTGIIPIDKCLRCYDREIRAGNTRIPTSKCKRHATFSVD